MFLGMLLLFPYTKWSPIFRGQYLAWSFATVQFDLLFFLPKCVPACAPGCPSLDPFPSHAKEHLQVLSQMLAGTLHPTLCFECSTELQMEFSTNQLHVDDDNWIKTHLCVCFSCQSHLGMSPTSTFFSVSPTSVFSTPSMTPVPILEHFTSLTD